MLPWRSLIVGDAMDEELFAQVYKLPMHDPCVDLLQKDFGAVKEKFGEHGLDDRVARDASLGDGLHEQATFEVLLLYLLLHERDKGRKHLLIDCQLLVHLRNRESPVPQVLLLNAE